MKKPNMLEMNKEMALAIADYYEYSMVYANIKNNYFGKNSVFDVIVRSLPKNKVIGTFEYEGIKYDKVVQRDYLVNAGLEQVLAYFTQLEGNKKIRDYIEDVQGAEDGNFLDWVENMKFKGDIYAMTEGTVFFGKEHQMRIHGKFEEAQIFESLILNTINPQTNVASTANDIAEVANKVLLEGGSRRAGSPQSAMFNSRAARIGGFTASSNVAYGMNNEEKVGGTHGHSYVMLYPSEYNSFKAQSKTFKDKVCFLLDTYNIKSALGIALKVVNEEKLEHFAFRIDSGNLLEQAKYIHKEMQKKGYKRKDYTLVASDDLTAGKISDLENKCADIDKYLVGTYVVNPPKPVTAVYKLAAYHDGENWIEKGKLSENLDKATLPGIKQVYRIIGKDGYYKKDIVAFEGEDLSDYLDEEDVYEPLLKLVVKNGELVYDMPTINEISEKRQNELKRFKDLKNYQVIVSDKVLERQKEIMKKYLNMEVRK